MADEWLVLSTGRCGSTALSDLIRHGSDVTSLSELFTPLQPLPDARTACTGDGMWAVLSEPRSFTTALTRTHSEPSEFLYRFDDGARFTRNEGVAPICITTLPHLVGSETDALFAELEPDVRALSPRPL